MHLAQPSRRGGLAELGSERTPSARPIVEEPRGAEPEVAAERDELRVEVALELLELRDRAGLDELDEAPLDPGADAAQLAGASLRTSSVDRTGVPRTSSPARR